MEPFTEFADKTWKMFSEDLSTERHNVIFAETPEGDLHVMMCPWQGRDSRDAVLSMVRAHMDEHGITRWMFYSEAWAAVCKAEGKTIDMRSIVPPSQDPNRIEVLTGIGIDEATDTILYRRATVNGTLPNRWLSDVEDDTSKLSESPRAGAIEEILFPKRNGRAN